MNDDLSMIVVVSRSEERARLNGGSSLPSDNEAIISLRFPSAGVTARFKREKNKKEYERMNFPGE